MWDWLQKTGNELGALANVLGTLSFFALLLGAVYQLWKTRAAIASSMNRSWYWLLSSIGGREYRRVYEARRLRRLRAKHRWYGHFGHRQETECLSRIYSRLSTFIWLSLFTGLIAFGMGIFMIGNLAIILEAEVLHKPVTPFRPPDSLHQWAGAFLSIAFACAWAYVAEGVAKNALLLSGSHRLRRMKG